MNSKIGSKISKNLIYTVAFVLVSLISLFYKLFLSGTFDNIVIFKNEDDAVVVMTEQTCLESSGSCASITQTSYETEQTQELLDVYICGQVVNPGVYEIASGSIVNDVVILAGGFTENAATERINLVYTIDHNVSIYIPGEDEIYEDNEIIRASGQTLWGDGSSSQQQDGSSFPVNINDASVQQLMTLPGIGEITANAIVEYREQTPFERIEDIMNVSGIGEAKFNSIRDLICV